MPRTSRWEKSHGEYLYTIETPENRAPRHRHENNCPYCLGIEEWPGDAEIYAEDESLYDDLGNPESHDR